MSFVSPVEFGFTLAKRTYTNVEIGLAFADLCSRGPRFLHIHMDVQDSDSESFTIKASASFDAPIVFERDESGEYGALVARSGERVDGVRLIMVPEALRAAGVDQSLIRGMQGAACYVSVPLKHATGASVTYTVHNVTALEICDVTADELVRALSEEPTSPGSLVSERVLTAFRATSIEDTRAAFERGRSAARDESAVEMREITQQAAYEVQQRDNQLAETTTARQLAEESLTKERQRHAAAERAAADAALASRERLAAADRHARDEMRHAEEAIRQVHELERQLAAQRERAAAAARTAQERFDDLRRRVSTMEQQLTQEHQASATTEREARTQIEQVRFQLEQSQTGTQAALTQAAEAQARADEEHAARIAAEEAALSARANLQRGEMQAEALHEDDVRQIAELRATLAAKEEEARLWAQRLPLSTGPQRQLQEQVNELTRQLAEQRDRNAQLEAAMQQPRSTATYGQAMNPDTTLAFAENVVAHALAAVKQDKMADKYGRIEMPAPIWHIDTWNQYRVEGDGVTEWAAKVRAQFQLDHTYLKAAVTRNHDAFDEINQLIERVILLKSALGDHDDESVQRSLASEQTRLLKCRAIAYGKTTAQAASLIAQHNHADPFLAALERRSGPSQSSGNNRGRSRNRNRTNSRRRKSNSPRGQGNGSPGAASRSTTAAPKTVVSTH